jgi:hypothetical protein
MDIVLRLRWVACTNLLMVFTGLYVFIAFPLPFSLVYFNFRSFIILLVILLVDYLFTLRLVNSLQQYLTSDLVRRYRLAKWSWIIVSFLNRFFLAAYTSYTATATLFPFLIPILIGLTSLLIGFLFQQLRYTTIAFQIRGRLRVLITLNYLNALFLLIPVRLPIFFQTLNMTYLIVLVIAGLNKGLTYFCSAWIFYWWSNRLVILKEENNALYPSPEYELVKD